MMECDDFCLGIEVLKLIEEMQLDSARPDYVTFVNVLSGCSHTGLVGRGWEYIKLMSNKFGEAARIEHYACMVDLLGEAGKLYEAKEFIESATIEHGLCLRCILLSVRETNGTGLKGIICVCVVVNHLYSFMKIGWHGTNKKNNEP